MARSSFRLVGRQGDRFLSFDKRRVRRRRERRYFCDVAGYGIDIPSRIIGSEEIKPFNFIISCHVAKLGHPLGVDPEPFHLIAPYETDPRKWEKIQWIDQYSGKRYRIAASGPHGSRTVARVKSYGDEASSIPATFTPSTLIRGATSGRPRYCPSSRPCRYANS